MAETVWTSGRLTAIYQPVGKDPYGRDRYRRAPFDLLEWASVEGQPVETYVNTLGINTIDSASVHAAENEWEVGHEFGFYKIGLFVIEPNQGNGGDDTWLALHSFGYI